MGEIKVLKINLNVFKTCDKIYEIIYKKIREYNINTNTLGEALRQMINDHYKDYVIPEIYGFSYINKKFTEHIVVGRILSIDIVEKSGKNGIRYMYDDYCAPQYPIYAILIIEAYCNFEVFDPLFNITSNNISIATSAFIRRGEYEKLQRLYKKQ